jgi:transcriptional regulator with XRE-family HTH domain
MKKTHPQPAPIGRQICDRRKLLGLTQADLAARLGTTQQQVQRWERGRAIGVADLCRIVDGLGMSAILDRDGPRLVEPAAFSSSACPGTHNPA